MAATETATMDDKDEDLSKPDDQTDPTEKSDENENGIEEMETSISDACDPEDVKEDDKDEDLSKPDDQSDPTEKSDENENGIVEMESSISDACDPEDVKEESTVTQQTETNPTDSVNVIIEHVKEESDTSLTIIDVNVNEDLENEVEKTDTELQKGIEHNDEELNAVRKNTVETIENAAIETVKSTEVPTSTEATDNESENSSKLVNPLKRKRSRPPKRKRKPKIHRVTKETALTEVPAESDLSVDTSMEMSKEDVEYCLTVSNLPNSWSFMDIKNYIDTECGPVDEIEMIKDDKTGNYAIGLSFQTEGECKEAMEKLKDKEIAGNKLLLEITGVILESDTEAKSETTEVSTKSWKPDLDSWEVDLHGMYGLKLQYLRSLGITPPLDKWVHVSNFRCDKAELRDVMEMAGNVQMCSVFTVSQRYANVMYSHPLEAVQAVSMLNNQMFYGQKLKVAMDRSPVNTVLLPKGLTNIGKGLGLSGKPLRNIVKHYERFVENKDCLINPAFFDVPANHLMNLNEGFETVKFEVKSVEEFNYPIATDTVKPVTAAKLKKTATPVQSTVAPKPKLQVQTPSKPLIVQKPAYPVPQPKPLAAPIKTNFTPPPQQTFRNPFHPNFRPAPYAGPQPTMNGQGMPPPQGAPVAMGPMMQSGPPRPQPHPGLAGPPRPQGQFPFPRPAGGSGPVWGPPGPMMQGPRGPMMQGPPGPMMQGPQGPMMQGPQGPMMQGPQGPMMQGPQGPMMQGPQGPMMQGPQGPMMQGPPRPGSVGPPGTGFSNEPVKLSLSNLPPSTTFALLCEKMSEWGHVVSIQLTTPGSAVVTFANRMQADACSLHFNGRNIENHFIQVKYAQ